MSASSGHIRVAKPVRLSTPLPMASTGVCSFRLEDSGDVHSRVHDGGHFDIVSAREAVAMTWRVAGEQRRGLIVDMRQMQSQTREAREYFTSKEVAEKISAVALLVGSPVSRVIANFAVRLGEHHVPIRIFTNADAARSWLAEQRRGR
jgi:hypothetical protein